MPAGAYFGAAEPSGYQVSTNPSVLPIPASDINAILGQATAQPAIPQWVWIVGALAVAWFLLGKRR